MMSGISEKEENRFGKRVNILRCIFCVAIFLISIQHIMKIYQPTLLDDEYSYWSIAAYFNGKDWSSITALCKYYSYGYSFFLCIIMKIFSDTVMMYRAAIVLNGVFLVLSFLVLESILGILYKEENKLKLCTLSFLMIMIPCNISFATVSLTECLLLFLFLIMVRFILKLNVNTGIFNMMVMGVVCGYSYMVHQRMLCFLAAMMIVMLVMIKQKKLTVKQFSTYVASVVVMFVVHHFIKAYIKQNLWLSASQASDNDYGSIIQNILYIFKSFKSVAVFIIGIAGKLFYYASATYIIGFFAIFAIAVQIWQMVKKQENNGKTGYVSMFLGISFVLMMLLSAVFMCSMEKMAFLVYGRYAEMMYPLLFSIGVLFMEKMIRENVIKFLYIAGTSVAIYGIMGIIVRWYSKRRGLTWVNYISCNQIYKYVQGDNLTILKMMVIVLVTFVAFAIVIGIRKYQKLAGILLAICCLGLFMQTSYIPLKAVNLELQKNRHATSGIAQFINKQKDSGGKVYYYISETEEDETAQYREYVQYWLQNVKLYSVTEKDMDKLNKDDLLLISCPEYSEVVDDSYDRIYENSMCKIYINCSE